MVRRPCSSTRPTCISATTGCRYCAKRSSARWVCGRETLMPKAMICRELGEPEVLRLESFDSKPLVSGQVRVAVRAAGLNYPDVLMVAGQYQHKPALPFIPGMEAAGDVAEVAPDVTGVAVGDRVIVKSRGVLTEEVVVAPSALAPMPSNFDYAQGATFLAAHG